MAFRTVRNILTAALAAIAGPVIAAGTHEQPPASLTVFAAASLKNALDEAAAAFTARTGHRVIASYAGSPALARQLEAGAPADVILSADTDWMDYLQSKNLIAAATRRNLFGNALVLVAPAGKKPDLAVADGFSLAAALAGGRLAVANVESVPAGKYAKAALQALRVWRDVEGKLAQSENVRAALAFVAQGEAPLGIVYKTDAFAENKVEIVGTFPAGSHPAIIYPGAVVHSTPHPSAAAELIGFLASPAAGEIFESHGFSRTP